MCSREFPRPGPARADRGRNGPFAALLARANQDPDAARGLALGYAEHRPEERHDLVRSVVADARAEGISPARILAHLLSVEDDAGLARSIADTIRAEGEEALAPAEGPAGYVAGNTVHGAAALVQPLYGPFVELGGIVWRQGQLSHTVFEPLAHVDDVVEWVRGLDPALEFEATALRTAAHAAAARLWPHFRAGGASSPGFERLAGLFFI